ncbi:hypothetical protein PM082_007575 [Marasmius tenuissimus]|nr:hypothetical protein PM082_007575 [Marasmius tenuissimus]
MYSSGEHNLRAWEDITYLANEFSNIARTGDSSRRRHEDHDQVRCSGTYTLRGLSFAFKNFGSRATTCVLGKERVLLPCRRAHGSFQRMLGKGFDLYPFPSLTYPIFVDMLALSIRCHCQPCHPASYRVRCAQERLRQAIDDDGSLGEWGSFVHTVTLAVWDSSRQHQGKRKDVGTLLPFSDSTGRDSLSFLDDDSQQCRFDVLIASP